MVMVHKPVNVIYSPEPCYSLKFPAAITAGTIGLILPQLSSLTTVCHPSHVQGQQDWYKRGFTTLNLPPAFNMKMIYYAQKEHHMCLQKALSHT